MCDHWHTVYTDKWRCASCGSPVAPKRKSLEGYTASSGRRIPMTEWEKMKLSFYRDEKKWHENIRNRKIVMENGKKHILMTDGRGNIRGEMPTP